MNNLTFKNGHYRVGDEIFESKILAVHRANELKKDWEWYFHDAEMKAVDWTVEPETHLDDFYKIRASQIREKYDYLIVFCSGGADSTNTVYSFLKNGLHVDEVVAGAPVSGLKNWNWSNRSTDAANTISETKFAQLPLMQEISTHYPKTKVTLHDYFIDMLDYKTDEWLLKSGDYIHPTFAARYNLERSEYSYIKKLADSGKKIGLVYGIDKPLLATKNDMLYTYFRDSLVCNGFQSIDHPNVSVELFYYSPDLVPMLIKQAHIAARWVVRPENKWIRDYAVISASSLNNQEMTRKLLGIYERSIVPLIYPAINKIDFQCHKPTSTFMGEHDAWFSYLHTNTRLNQLMFSDYNNFTKDIDSRFFRINPTNKILGFRLAYKYHQIGPVSNFTQQQVT